MAEKYGEKLVMTTTDKDIIILGIETSCDETAICLLRNGREIMSNIISSQIPVHRKYGGVVPEIASRKHTENILTVLKLALAEAEITLSDIDAIAVTNGPGLIGALLVGVAAAKSLSFALDKPLIGVNHLEGHIFANFIEHKQLEPPFIALVVSGGHTSLIHVNDYQDFVLLGQTRDDAAGEAFDKVARVMGLNYPGGPEVELLAKKGDEQAIAFPRAVLDKELDFSFSGIKSSVINYLHKQKQNHQAICPANVAASFQSAVVHMLAEKSLLALQKMQLKKLVVAGGVSANKTLRSKLQVYIDEIGGELYYPSNVLCTDNAAMIACRGYYHFKDAKIDTLELNANSNLKIGYRVE